MSIAEKVISGDIRAVARLIRDIDDNVFEASRPEKYLKIFIHLLEGHM